MIKLNFDGASKGNPGQAGYGGIFQDCRGNPLLIFFGSIGWDTNNSAELEGLWQGLCLAQQHNFQPVVIEGDSQIFINMANQLLTGSPASKVANNWRMADHLELIEQWLRTNRAITFNHVKREGNKVANLLANKAVDSDQVLQSGSLIILNDNSLIQPCANLVHKDTKLPNASVNQD